ncbi:cation-translocating P-type ATPase [Variovorax sp. dw_308]|uniref:heavy metal translocating P-type ATPase n=1 Tax=Variovorax sp. dw_308 TaxID=2721546 RepID=UPI001C481202|nr:heavy metal translocating P-type ATPase [Variovorax sp. dw_308]
MQAAALPLEQAGPDEFPAAQAGGGLEAVLDDPAEWSAFSRLLDGDPHAGRWESHAMVEGMHCAACAFAVEAALLRVPGVEQVEVNAASRRARLTWSAAQVAPSAWFRASEAAGYRLVPAGDTFVRERRLHEERLALWRWLVAGLCMMQVMMYAYPAYVALPGDMSADSAQLLRWASWVLTLPVLLFSCKPFFAAALRDVAGLRIGMELPVALGIVITFAVSSAATFDPSGTLGGEVYFDSLTMFVFFLLTGRWLESRLRGRTAGALEALMNRQPDSADRLTMSGAFERVAVRRLLRGDVVRVRPGESFPADGVISLGSTTADEALLTGESRPVVRDRGARVLAGSHNLSSTVEVRVESVGQGTRFAQIVSLMESASLHKPRLASMADRAARPFLFFVLCAAMMAAAFWWPVDHGKALMVAVAVLIVTCPCALSLATPAATLASAGMLARHGVLVRNLQGLEELAAVDTVIFDKTGTLTLDTPCHLDIRCRPGMQAGEALDRAAAIAAQSLHPASQALVDAWNAASRPASSWKLVQAIEHVGMGVEARMVEQGKEEAGTRRMLLGSAAFCGVVPLGADAPQVHLSDAQGWVASFVLDENVRAEATAAIDALRSQGLSVHLLSGDRAAAAHAVAQQTGIRSVHGDCTPEAKLAFMKALQDEGHGVAMVGDGLNDGPVLARADASFALGNAVPLAKARADFIVMGDDLGAIPAAHAQAKRTMRVVRQNLWWAAGYNALCVPLAAMGMLPAWLAGLGMAASSLVVVLNAARLAGRSAAGH